MAKLLVFLNWHLSMPVMTKLMHSSRMTFWGRQPGNTTGWILSSRRISCQQYLSLHKIGIKSRSNTLASFLLEASFPLSICPLFNFINNKCYFFSLGKGTKETLDCRSLQKKTYFYSFFAPRWKYWRAGEESSHTYKINHPKMKFKKWYEYLEFKWIILISLKKKKPHLFSQHDL